MSASITTVFSCDMCNEVQATIRGKTFFCAVRAVEQEGWASNEDANYFFCPTCAPKATKEIIDVYTRRTARLSQAFS